MSILAKATVSDAHPFQNHKISRVRRAKKKNNFDKLLMIASKGILKAKNKDQVQDKTKENLDNFLEEETVGEILRVSQVDYPQVDNANQTNDNFHGQKSNLEQLGPKGLRAYRANGTVDRNSTFSNFINSKSVTKILEDGDSPEQVEEVGTIEEDMETSKLKV